MARERLSTAPADPETPTESEEHVDIDGDYESEETIEEEIEDGEIKEEVEDGEIEEEVDYGEMEEEKEEGEIEEEVAYGEMEEEKEEGETEEEKEEGETEEEEEEGEIVEEEAEEEEENEEAADDVDVQNSSDGEEEEDEDKKHALLLALPPHGSEVYLGGIPRDASEEDVKSFCESIGEVIMVRIMKEKDSGEGKGFAFVTFRTKELASQAIEELNNTEFKGKKVRCSTSQGNHHLFIGNVPRNWGEEDMKKVVENMGPGVINVELLKGRNCGSALIEYYNHACAEYSRNKMSNPEFKLDNNAPTVRWADPGSSSTSQVFVTNLPKDITQDQLMKLFEHHGKITKVVLPPAKLGHEKSRYGFVHFAERSSAMKALKNTEKYEIDGQVLDCSLAKRQADQKSSGGSDSQKPTLHPMFPPQLGYGLSGAYGALGAGAGYGALGAGYGATGFSHPLIYGRGSISPGMPMMPMPLPDGRIGYVLQQPGMQSPIRPPQRRGSTGGGAGTSGGGGRSNDGNRGRNRYNPY